MNRRDLLRALAPPAPPCFPAPGSWLEWLLSADAYQPPNSSRFYDSRTWKVVVIVDNQATFNRDLNFCRDCQAGYQALMQQQGKCNPNALRKEVACAATA